MGPWNLEESRLQPCESGEKDEKGGGSCEDSGDDGTLSHFIMHPL